MVLRTNHIHLTVLHAATVDGGAENALSCESSVQSLNDSDVTITLVWDSNKLTTEHLPKRLHLFSHCINPTNTSLVSILHKQGRLNQC